MRAIGRTAWQGSRGLCGAAAAWAVALVVALGAAGGCGGAQRAATGDEPPARVEAEPAVEPVPAPPAAPAEATAPAPIVYLEDGEVFTIVPGDAPRATGLRPDGSCAETLGVGSGAPLLSPDGTWLAYVFEGDLHAVELARPAEAQRITRLARAADLCVQLAAWSPDGTQLLYHVEERMTQYGPDTPLPADTPRGFFSWLRAGGALRALPALEGFEAWSADGDAVLHARSAPGGQRMELLRIALADGAVTVLDAVDDPYGFGQLVTGRTLAAWATRTGLRVAPLAEVTAAIPLVSGAFAEYQFPKLSPDERHVLWRHQTGPVQRLAQTLELRTVAPDGPVVSLGPLSSLGEYEWLDDTHVLVCDARGLWRKTLTGEETALGGPGACFVRRTP